MTRSGALGSLPSLLQRIYSGREVQDVASTLLSLDHLPDPDLLLGMDAICQLLIEALGNDQKITVVGDYDADGATATALALKGLKALGFHKVDYLVPNRFVSGYGLSSQLIDQALLRGTSVILTVDNGISSHEAVRIARSKGLKVLITDHHLPGPELPEAHAIVNPNLPGDPFPGKALAGVGVLFYVLLGLRRRLRQSGTFESEGRPEPSLGEFLDLVALGTVADLVPLDQTNRILVHQGLRRIRSGKASPGIKALIMISEKKDQSFQSRDLGFSLAPRLNAAGRLEDMALGIECLLSEDLNPALEIANRLGALNQERRQIEQEMRLQASEQLESLELSDRPRHPVPCLFHEEWHQGVIGILASRIKEALDQPVIAFAVNDQDPTELKGSARSVPGIHIRDLLANVACRDPSLIRRFGGHAMAAGLSIARSSLVAFQDALEEEARGQGIPDLPSPELASDGPLAVNELSVANAMLIADAGPWGQSFPEPLFDGIFEVIAPRVVGERHLKMSLRPEGGLELVDAIAFQLEKPHAWLRCTQIKAAYRLDLNTFRGKTSLQLKIEYMESLNPLNKA